MAGQRRSVELPELAETWPGMVTVSNTYNTPAAALAHAPSNPGVSWWKRLFQWEAPWKLLLCCFPLQHVRSRYVQHLGILTSLGSQWKRSQAYSVALQATPQLEGAWRQLCWTSLAGSLQ